jgi:hypothetical protein
MLSALLKSRGVDWMEPAVVLMAEGVKLDVEHGWEMVAFLMLSCKATISGIQTRSNEGIEAL